MMVLTVGWHALGETGRLQKVRSGIVGAGGSSSLVADPLVLRGC